MLGLGLTAFMIVIPLTESSTTRVGHHLRFRLGLLRPSASGGRQRSDTSPTKLPSRSSFDNASKCHAYAYGSNLVGASLAGFPTAAPARAAPWKSNSHALASISTDDHSSTLRAGILVSHDENAWCLPLQV